MGAFIDLTDQRFGRLVVIEKAGLNKHKQTLWKCRCDCGIEKILNGGSLKNGRTQSCGCLNFDKLKARKINLIGKKFGKLTVISEAGRNDYGSFLWQCFCSCGRKKVILGYNLRSGIAKSCGICTREGKNNSNYNPNLTEEDRQDRRLIPGYSAWVQSVFKRDDYTCQACGDATGGNLIAHHIESYNNNKDLRIALDNGVTLCETCHKDFHHQYGYGSNTKKQFKQFKEDLQ